MKVVRYKKNNQVFELEVDGLSTNLFLDGNELFENDIVVWGSVSLVNNDVTYYVCKIIWSTYFNGWSLIRVEIPNDDEIPIGECGIPLSELTIYDNIL